MSAPDSDEVLVALRPSGPRRWVGIGSLGALGVILLWLALSGKPGFGFQVGFLIGAVLALAAAEAMRRASGSGLELTRDVLRTDSGRVLTKVSNVRSVERGAFAFKPSNGFLVRLKSPAGRGWAPGLWWQRGTWLGVGGTVPGGQARAMAEVLMALVKGIYPEDDD